MPDSDGTPWTQRIFKPVSTSAAAAAKSAKRAGSRAARVARSSAGETSKLVLKAGTVGKGSLDAAIQAALDAPPWMSKAIFRECTIPVYVLPTGPSAEDYYCAFQLDEVFAQFRSGFLVRPTLLVYAARDDMDRVQLGTALKREFARQFNDEKHRQREDIEAALTPLLAEGERKRGRVSGGITLNLATVTIALVGIVLASNPLVDLAIFGVALVGGRSAVKDLMGWLRLSRDVKDDAKPMREQMKQIDEELDAKNESFRKAVNNLRVHIHPRLYTLASLFCEVNGMPGPNKPANPEAVLADLGRVMLRQDFLAQVPSEYHPLVRVVAEE